MRLKGLWRPTPDTQCGLQHAGGTRPWATLHGATHPSLPPLPPPRPPPPSPAAPLPPLPARHSPPVAWRRTVRTLSPLRCRRACGVVALHFSAAASGAAGGGVGGGGARAAILRPRARSLAAPARRSPPAAWRRTVRMPSPKRSRCACGVVALHFAAVAGGVAGGGGEGSGRLGGLWCYFSWLRHRPAIGTTPKSFAALLLAAALMPLMDCDSRRRLHWRLAVGRWSVTLMVPHMVHLQDVVKLHTFVLGHLGALLLACFGFDHRFALVAFDLVSDSIWCEGVGVGVGARGGSTWPGGDYLRGGLGWEKWANLSTTDKARSHKHTQAQATQPLHRGPPSPISTAFQQIDDPN